MCMLYTQFPKSFNTNLLLDAQNLELIKLRFIYGALSWLQKFDGQILR